MSNGTPRDATLDEVLRGYGTLRALAKKLGITEGYLWQIRKGRVTPSEALAKAISRETGVPVDAIRRERAA